MSNAIAKLYRHLESVGYPQAALAWLRARRLAVIILLAVACWLVLLLMIWLLWVTLSG